MKELLLLAHSLSNFVVGTEGNVSQKHKNSFYVKASGTELKFLTKKDLIKCNLSDSKQLSTFDKKPSIETEFHNWLLKQENINFVAHTHPTNTLKILCSSKLKKFARVRLFPDQVVFNGKESCLVDYVHPGPELKNAIKESVLKFVKNKNYFPKLILLKNHGIICCGKTYKECLIATQICEKSAEIFIGSTKTKNYTYLKKKNIKKILNDKKEIYRQKIIT